jgi:hypothetical protein
VVGCACAWLSGLRHPTSGFFALALALEPVPGLQPDDDPTGTTTGALRRTGTGLCDGNLVVAGKAVPVVRRGEGVRRPGPVFTTPGPARRRETGR